MISSPIRLFAAVGALIGLGLIISKYDPSHAELIENGKVLSATTSAQPQQHTSENAPTNQPQTNNHQSNNVFFDGVDLVQEHLNPF